MGSSQDILFIVLAFCALWFTAFICWLLYQVAMILRNANLMISELRDKIGKVESALTSIKDRIEGTTGHFTLIAEGVKTLVAYLIEKKISKKKSTSKKK